MATHDSIRIKENEIIDFYERYYEESLADIMKIGNFKNNQNIKDMASNINCYIIGKITLVRTNNYLDLLKGLERGIQALK